MYADNVIMDSHCYAIQHIVMQIVYNHIFSEYIYIYIYIYIYLRIRLQVSPLLRFSAPILHCSIHITVF
jgi:hypothetical protein